ncbi:unnamed protein product [Caenorhabditis angaria]|uniref:SXP/RAL-2 family protein Ani s 5-like cation-binding domain-containing protein n=1 Tax=Caenorhabditis angaria TaxID=860376 RepID=A0A9P1J177_9PELO|nr:unnamed protein product [Caenorhabditis angaria]
MNRLYLFFVILFVTLEAGVVERKNDDEEMSEYDLPEKPFPGSVVHVMQIVQRDTKGQTQKDKHINEIIRALPTDDHLGKFLNNSFDKAVRDVETGNDALHSKLTNYSSIAFSIFPLFLAFMFLC